MPNSIRVGGGRAFLEYVPIHDAGRYRAAAGTAAADDPLNFDDGADSSFDVLGPPVTVLAGDSLVVYNLGIAGANVYETPLTSRRLATAGAGLSKVSFTSTGSPLPFASPGSRFQIVGNPVSYACDLATGTLWRYSGYGFLATQPVTLATLNGSAGGGEGGAGDQRHGLHVRLWRRGSAALWLGVDRADRYSVRRNGDFAEPGQRGQRAMNGRASVYVSRRAAINGFALPSAIFLLVILAGLAAFMVTFSTTQSITSAQDVQGSRAYQAARSGTEWGLYRVLDPTNATVVVPGAPTWPNMPACPADTVLPIEGFNVTVNCTSSDYTEAGTTRSIRVFFLRSTASVGVVGSLGFIERRVEVAVSKCRALDGAAADDYACP